MKKIDKFIEWLELNYEREATRAIYLYKMNDFFKSNDVFDQESINEYLKNKKVSNGTFNLIRSSLMSYQKFLTNHLKKPLDINYPRPRTPKEGDPKFITEEQLEEIIEKIPIIFQEFDKARAVIMIAFYTGLRPREFTLFKRNNINMDKCTIELTNTKTHADRKVVFPKKIKKYIEDYFSRTEEIDNAFNVDKIYLEYICRRIKQCFDLKDFSPYVLRHSFAKWYMKISKNNGKAVQKLMGHSNILTTLGYTKYSNDEAIDLYNSLVNKPKKKKRKKK